jgi:hypothetical protein
VLNPFGVHPLLRRLYAGFLQDLLPVVNEVEHGVE